MTNYSDGRIHGWNGGNGGACPVHPKSVVLVWRRGSCRNHPDLAGNFNWQHGLSNLDIIAFQVTKEYREPKTIWVNEYGAIQTVHTSREDAERSARNQSYRLAGLPDRVAIKYMEVFE